MDVNNINNDTINPLPYVIIFAVLFLIALGALTWTLSVWYKENQCALNPNIWCSDNWICNNNCPTGSAFNPCFYNSATGSIGLGSCLYGPTAAGANICSTLPPGSSTGTSCPCPSGIQNVNSCLAGCAQNIGSVPNGTICCCQPGTPGCQYTTNTLPAVCRPTNA